MPLLVRSDPFRDIDRFMQHLMEDSPLRPSAMRIPMDAYHKADMYLLQFDLPGVTMDSIDLTVEDNTLTVKAERKPPTMADGVETVVAERSLGTFTRRVFLGDKLDTARIEAHYDCGVLTLTIPLAEEAKPRRIEVHADAAKEITV